MKSIRGVLLMWLFAGLAAAIVLAAALVYQRAGAEANRLFDDQMQQLAVALPTEGLSALRSRELGEGAGGQLLVQWWDEDSLRLNRDAAPGGIPLMPVTGFADVRGPGGQWRVYTARLPGGVIQIAQPQWVRSERAAGTALRTVTPMLFLFPLVAILAWLGVANGLAPLRRLAQELRMRGSHSLLPVAEARLPEEIRPLGEALNDLLQRLGQALDAQRAFVADAAHELRTPLTALKLQIQLAERARDEGERQEAFVALRDGFERASHLVQQLLLLARQDPGKVEANQAPVALDALVQGVLELHRAASASGALRVAQVEPACVLGDADALAAMINNLVDNALRHGGNAGPVELSLRVEGKAALLAVQDQGPGIPEQDLARVFDRFYRVPGTASEGTGLGLAIVQRVAQLHGGQVQLTNTRPGLRATVSLPLAEGERPPNPVRQAVPPP